jgi:hypothetical protein
MKKTFILIFTILVVIMIIVFVNIQNIQKNKQKILNYNLEFEYYCKEEILGIDITTLINKAINENEKNDLEKDEKGYYLPNEENSIKIFIKMKAAEDIYPMENFYKAGINDFTKYFGSVKFKSIDINYHEKTGQISEIYFEEQ